MSVHDAEGDAVRLLRAIDAEQAHRRIRSIVFPFAAAQSAGLRTGTERYEEALWGLVWEEALTVDEHVPLEVAARLLFGRAPYRVAPAAGTHAGKGIDPYSLEECVEGEFSKVRMQLPRNGRRNAWETMGR
jgi:hypothetical protein